MPWRQEPTKDGVSSEKLWGAASRLRATDIRMGEPGGGNAPSSMATWKGTRGTETSKYPEEE